MMDVYDLWKHNEALSERKLARLPVCCVCEEPIQDEELFDIHGKLYHEECAVYEFKRSTEDYEK